MVLGGKDYLLISVMLFMFNVNEQIFPSSPLF